ncbi:MAG: hydantoinase B/oxoprolinase family protein [Candidatus Acidiferrales bacterium]
MARKLTDIFTLEIIQEGLISAAEEMFHAFGRTSKSPVIYEVLDYACGITDHNGELIAQAAGVPGFLGTLDLAVKQTLVKFKNRIYAGDVFITNDPYGNGTHLNDVTLIRPILHGGVLVAFAISKGHWSDVGGMHFGSWTSDSTEIYQEGLFFPVMKLYSRGEPSDNLIEMIRHNVRMPEMTIGDMFSQEASLRVAARHVEELCAKYGLAAIRQAIRKILTSGDRVSREALKRLPHGIFEAEDFIDDDGIHDQPIRVKVKVTISPRQFVVDLRGSSPQVSGSINATFPASLCTAKATFKAITSPHAPANEGNFRVLQVQTDPGSIFHALPPAPTSTYWETDAYVGDLMMRALAPHIPDRLPAGHFLSVCGTILGGYDERKKQSYALVEPQPGGWGATATHDGPSGQFCLGDGETLNMSNEVIEAKYPIRVEQYALNIEAGTGAGKHRGGFGVIKDYRLLSRETNFTASFGRAKFPPWGLLGGGAGTCNRIGIIRAAAPPESHGKVAARKLQDGDVIRLATGGGGGFGRAIERDPEAVQADVRNDLLTVEQAREVYAVAINQQTLAVEREATAALRASSNAQAKNI